MRRLRVMSKLAVETLPARKDVPGAKRWEEEKGEFVQIAYGEEIRHLAFFTLRPGFWRGSHYHEKKREVFYVLEGVMRGLFLDRDSGERMERYLRQGERVRIDPGLAHILYGIEDARVVEYSDRYYDERDAIPYDFSTWESPPSGGFAAGDL